MSDEPDDLAAGGRPDPSPSPSQAAADEASLLNRRASDANPIKRKLVVALVGLYSVSVIAAAAVLWRTQTAARAEGREGGFDLKPVANLLSSKKGAVAVMTINGPIYRSANGRIFEKGVQQWGRKLEKLAKQDEVKAIVLNINSPGGSVGAVQELYDTIDRIKQEHKKPIVAHLGDVAASGGYYLAVKCDRIVAHPGTLLGSIGVIFNNVNVEGLLRKVGVESRVIKSGKMKDIGSMSRPMTEEERRLLQDLIDNAYGQFLAAVSAGRKMPVDDVRPIADGRIFTGEQALENGLVDDLGDSYSAVLLAAKLGGIKDAKPRILRDGDSLSSFMEMLDSKLSIMRSPDMGLLGELKERTYHGLEYRW